MKFVKKLFAAAIVACSVAHCLLASLVCADEFTPQQLELFEKQIRPLLIEHCLKCHGHEKQEGGLNLATRELLIKGSDSGAAVVTGIHSGEARNCPTNG